MIIRLKAAGKQRSGFSLHNVHAQFAFLFSFYLICHTCPCVGTTRTEGGLLQLSLTLEMPLQMHRAGCLLGDTNSIQNKINRNKLQTSNIKCQGKNSNSKPCMNVL